MSPGTAKILVGAFLDIALTLDWNAAAAGRHGMVRPTGHFNRIDGLAVQNWVRG